MITAKIVKYYNDYNQKAFDKTFEKSGRIGRLDIRPDAA